MGTAGDPTPFEAAAVLTLRVAPELAGTEEVEQAFAPALAVPPGTPVVVDLSAVTFLTLEAVVPLLAFVERCAAEGKALLIVASAYVRRKWALLGLDPVIPLQPAG
ncbi:STAS domain-containing protein [Amycolatopsis sp. WQ 127309]|uniref:STAS domain-containing protein n=1 Tax=Amycolatopsis sp. WQ 127309 TaxID=2932773 RepID=UPI001FF24182|nr:STAS domain-containing protein [Amycolatopsis sp. WQ 127309]UOZ02670.1 STAS domain-containing protein [Amycolatopsis sp. WQ 127309]